MIVKGLSSIDNGIENAKILQEAIDNGGEIIVEDPGVYPLADTIYIGDHTYLEFKEGVYFKRMPSPDGVNGNAFINRGALTRTTNEDIKVKGLRLEYNGVEHTMTSLENPNYKTVLGLRAHIAFLYIKDLVLEDIEVLDMGVCDYAIQISNFENVLVQNIRAEGDKDGIHFGPGKHFVLRHAVFATVDDPIALNAFDYSVSNPNPGWIEDGLIEDIREIDNGKDVGFCFFTRMLCGAWQDWYKGMVVQHSDAVAHNGIIYRVKMKPDFETYVSNTPPTHDKGFDNPDGIVWYRTCDSDGYTSGCRNIHFKDITISRNRKCAFGFTQEKSEYCRSYYPNSTPMLQENITFENVKFEGDVEMFAWVNSPIDKIKLINCEVGDSKIIHEPVETEGLVYPDAKIYLQNTKVSEGFLVTEKDNIHIVSDK